MKRGKYVIYYAQLIHSLHKYGGAWVPMICKTIHFYCYSIKPCYDAPYIHSQSPMKDALTKRASTFFLKGVLVLITIAVLALCVFLLPQIWIVVLRELPEFTRLTYPALIGFSASALPFFFAIFQAFMLLQYIDKNSAFSEVSVQALRNIKFSAIAMSVCYAMCIPILFTYAQIDDAPGLGAITLAIVCAPLVVATFAAVLQKLVQNAVDMKAENDLTI
jgi:cellulose synthase/poly-beta-1,6-N-acetylglucosamine synthase-like glycosyltransferase